MIVLFISRWPICTCASSGGLKPASNSIKPSRLATKQDEKVYIYFLRGALAERQKHYDDAEVQFRKVLAIDPNNSMTLNYLGYMQADRGVKLDEALTMIQQAVKQEPQNYAYLDSLGWAYLQARPISIGGRQPASRNRA